MPRLPGLDLMRCIAILWVLWFHAQVGGLQPALPNVAGYGWMGVDLFFVLSGFLIGSQWLAACRDQGRPALSDFYLRRAFRILPAFLVVVAIYFAFPGWRERPGIQPLWQFLTFSENLLINYFDNQAFSHVWSLCVEEHFYLLFPLLALWMYRRASHRHTMALCLALLLGGMALRAGIWQGLLADLPLDDAIEGNFFQRYIEWIYYPTYTRLDGLLAGVILAVVHVQRPEWWAALMQHGNRLLVGGLMCMALSLWLFAERFDFWPTVIGFPLLSFSLALLVAAACSRRSLLGRWRLPGAAWLAAISYSLYLSHKLVYRFVRKEVLPQLPLEHWLHSGPGQFLLYAFAVLLAAALLYYLIERPGLQLRDWFMLRRQRNAPVLLGTRTAKQGA